MERSEIRGSVAWGNIPDCAALHPGYAAAAGQMLESHKNMRAGPRVPPITFGTAIVAWPLISEVDIEGGDGGA
jgi:hypothetical protein